MTESDEVYCTNCRARISEKAPYCPECGAEQAHVAKSKTPENDKGKQLPPDEEYCISCGEVISADVPFCPECGSEQSQETVDEDSKKNGATSWLIGFRPGSTLRNIGMSLLYFFIYPIGIPLLIYGYLNGKRGWSRRKIGISVGSIVLVLMVSLVAVGLTADLPEETTESNSQSSAPANSVQEASSGENEKSLDVAVRIKYAGEWSGALAVTRDGGSNTRSISGSGTTTLSIDGDPEIVSVNAQKQDDSSATLVVQIIEDGEVISESRTSSQYGVAQTSSDIDDFI